MKKPLLRKKQLFLSYIQNHTLKNGQPPSYEEIMSALNFSSIGTVIW